MPISNYGDIERILVMISALIVAFAILSKASFVSLEEFSFFSGAWKVRTSVSVFL